VLDPTRQITVAKVLALALLVLGIGADDSHHTPTLNDFALFATSLNGRFYLHHPHPFRYLTSSVCCRLQASEYLRFAIGDGDGMLEVSRTFTIGGDDSPAIAQHSSVPVTGCDHRL
jgi:hypothetical protein